MIGPRFRRTAVVLTLATAAALAWSLSPPVARLLAAPRTTPSDTTPPANGEGCNKGKRVGNGVGKGNECKDCYEPVTTPGGENEKPKQPWWLNEITPDVPKDGKQKQGEFGLVPTTSAFSTFASGAQVFDVATSLPGNENGCLLAETGAIDFGFPLGPGGDEGGGDDSRGDPSAGDDDRRPAEPPGADCG